MQPNPLHSGDVRHPADELRNHRLVVEVYAIIGKFLFDNLKLFHTLFDQFLHLVKNVVYRPRDMFAGD